MATAAQLKIEVPGSNGDVHTVRKVASGLWTCSCKDHVNRAKGEPYVCRHISKLTMSLVRFVSSTPTKSKKAEEYINRG